MPQQFGHLDLQSVGNAEHRPAAQLAADRLHEDWMGMPEDERAVAEEVVDVFVLVDVPDPGPRAVGDEDRMRMDEAPVVRSHAAGNDLPRRCIHRSGGVQRYWGQSTRRAGSRGNRIGPAMRAVRSSRHQPAPIDMENLPGDVAASVRGEEQGSFGDLPGRPIRFRGVIWRACSMCSGGSPSRPPNWPRSRRERWR